MREKYEAFNLVDLKEIAKKRGIKSVSAMKKSQVIEAILALDEAERAQEAEKQKTKEAVDSAPQPQRAEKEPEAKKAVQIKETGNTDRQQKAAVYETGSREAGRTEQAEAGASSPESSGGVRENARGYRVNRRINQDRPVREYNRPTQEERPAREYNRPTQEERPVREYNRPAQEERPVREYNRAAQEERPVREYNRPAQEERPARESYREPVRTAREPEAAQEERKQKSIPMELDSGMEARGILEVLPEGFGFIRSDNYMPGEQDVYVSPSQIRRFNLKTGDIVRGNTRIKSEKEKFSALLFIKSVNGMDAEVNARRFNFEDMTPIFPDERMVMERPGCSVAMRVMDLLSPVGKGQRGMIVSPPKAGKTTLLKEVAQSIQNNHPDVHLIILLIDERPEEVTDIKEAIKGPMVEVIHSTFDELPEHHKRVAEMTIERAKRLVEHKQNVCILLDSITRLTRAYNLTVPPSGRTLSGGLDPASLHMPKRFFGAARNMREGGSLTILATALVDTGSKMDDVVYEEFKGTGNMEIILDRKLSERRIFPAIDIPKSGTRREDLLLSEEELEAVTMMRRGLNGMRPEEAVDKILDLFARTRNNREFILFMKKQRLF